MTMTIYIYSAVTPGQNCHLNYRYITEGFFLDQTMWVYNNIATISVSYQHS